MDSNPSTVENVAGTADKELTATTSDSSEQTSPYAWYSVGILLLAYTCSIVDRGIVSLLITPIKRDLGVNDFQVGLLGGLAFALLYTLFGFPIGRLADTKNRRNIIAAGIVVWSLMTALCGFAKSFWQLFLARMGVGIGEAALSPPAYSLITDAFPQSKVGRALSVYSIGVYVGGAVAYLVGSLLIQALEGRPPVTLPVVGSIQAWQQIFIIVGLPGLLIAGLVMTIPEPLRRGVSFKVGVDGKTRVQAVPVRQVLQYAWSNKAAYGTLFGGFSMLSLFSYGIALWIPEFLSRTYDLQIYESGYIYGAIILTTGIGGVMTGGVLCDWLRKRGRKDGYMLCVVLAVFLTTPFAIAFPLAPNVETSIVLMACQKFAAAMPIGATVAALQFITPNQMRSQFSALYLFIVNLIGIGIGPALVGLFTDYVFGDPLMIGASIALTAVLTLPVGVVVLFLGLKPYRAAAETAKIWKQSE